MEQPNGRIVVHGLTKQFKTVRAVDDLTFTVEPGTVTGFLGPNGAGKTTTLRMLLGLVTPTAGTATIGGLAYDALPNPFRAVGAALEASSFHKARTGRDHLRVLCAAAGFPDRRADEVLDMVGMTPAARRKVGGYSMGMKQRLALAAAMLGDPGVLILDEPANGLDPEGIRWMRGFLRGLAAQGRTVLVSSHLLAEVAQTADDVVIIAAGRSVRQGKVADLTAQSRQWVRVKTPDPDHLTTVLRNAGAQVDPAGPQQLYIQGVDAPAVNRLAGEAGIAVHELTTETADLEQIFLELTSGKGQIR
jgi:ABC-2 type transport system ATP-binding protein